MELEFTSDQEELRDSVRSFLEKECSTEVVRAAVATGQADQLWASMVALDWPGLTVPEEFGGIGLTFVETSVVVEELGRVVAPGPLFSTLTQFVPLVREVGNVDQQDRFLTAVASSALTGTLALSDHPKAWSLDDVTLVAERVEGGWVLDGTKLGLLGITDETGELVVVARAGEGFGAFVVPAARAGLARVRSLDASRPLATATLRHVVVTDDRALGEPGSEASERGIRRALEEATAALALETVGACDTLFQLVLAYVKERKQFDVPVGSFQAIKHKTVTSTALVALPVTTLTSAAAVPIADSYPVLAGAVTLLRPGTSLATVRGEVQVTSPRPYVLSISARAGTAVQAEATADAVGESYIGYAGSDGLPAGHIPAVMLSPAMSASGAAGLTRLLVGAMLGLASGVLIGVIAALGYRRLILTG